MTSPDFMNVLYAARKQNKNIQVDNSQAMKIKPKRIKSLLIFVGQFMKKRKRVTRSITPQQLLQHE